MEEAYFSPIRGSQSTARYYSTGQRDDNVYAHSVLIVETKNGESYVLDIAGAQNGQFEAVVPTETFIDREMAKMSQLHPHGRELDHFLRTADGSSPMGEGADIRSPQILCQTHQQLGMVIQEWERTHETSIQELVREAPQNVYEQCKTSLLTKVSTDLKAFVAQWEKEGKVLKPIASRLIGLPLVGFNKCTVVPDGAGVGSRAYQEWIKANQNHTSIDMPKSSLSSNEEIDRLVKSFKTSTAGMFLDPKGGQMI